MAEQVRVPGTELEELRDLLRRVAAFVDAETKVNALDEAVGAPLREPRRTSRTVGPTGATSSASGATSSAR